MQISQMFKRKPCVFSIECFPPKQTANFDKMKDTLRTMRTLNPDFISVTYGAGGGTSDYTVKIAFHCGSGRIPEKRPERRAAGPHDLHGQR